MDGAELDLPHIPEGVALGGGEERQLAPSGGSTLQGFIQSPWVRAG
jgi:hypothetical protein